jgi:hypothetical protein
MDEHETLAVIRQAHYGFDLDVNRVGLRLDAHMLRGGVGLWLSNSEVERIMAEEQATDGVQFFLGLVGRTCVVRQDTPHGLVSFVRLFNQGV